MFSLDSYGLDSTSGNDTAVHSTSTVSPTAYKSTKRTRDRSRGWILGVTIAGSLFVVAWLAALFSRAPCCKKSACAKRKVATESHLRYSPDERVEASV